MSKTTGNPIQTTDAGIPVESDQYSLTVGAGGPILLQDSYYSGPVNVRRSW